MIFLIVFLDLLGVGLIAPLSPYIVERFSSTGTAVAITLTTLLDNIYVAHRAGHGMLRRNLALGLGKIFTLGVLSAGTAPGGTLGAGAVLVSWTLPILLVSAVTMVAGPGRYQLVDHTPHATTGQFAHNRQ